MKRTLIVTAAAALTLVAGCSHGSDRSAGSAAAGAIARPAPDGAKGQPAAQGNAAPQVADPSVKIVTADLAVRVPAAADVAGRADRAGTIARRYGGDVYSEERTGGAHARAELTLKVLPAQLRPALDDLGRLGQELQLHQSTQDVTGEVADVDSRVRSARAAIDKLNALYARATKISDLLTIDSQLADREADLEALQAKQRALAAQTSYARIDLTLTTAATPPPQPAKHAGFLGGLQAGWDAFVTAAGAVATGIGAIVPFTLLGAVLAAAAFWLRRRLRHRPPQPSA